MDGLTGLSSQTHIYHIDTAHPSTKSKQARWYRSGYNKPGKDLDLASVFLQSQSSAPLAVSQLFFPAAIPTRCISFGAARHCKGRVIVGLTRRIIYFVRNNCSRFPGS
ncbi:hypothetical protein Mapa_009883 [Marchantia paleacea]|nr:hypothetical protein Mapa_009883 [Marchantia paleacea]